MRSSGSETKPKKQQQQKKKDSSKSSGGITEPKRIRSYDYQAWDKFDVVRTAFVLLLNVHVKNYMYILLCIS